MTDSEKLDHILKGLEELRTDVREMKIRLAHVGQSQVANETMLAAVLKALGGLQEQMAALNGRMDRFDERMRRIETRLGLTDEQP